MARRGGNKAGGTIIIRREEVTEGAHHGGAWKVAYADFVTAMMAFFLLLWLLNATTDQQRKGLADYFAPANALSSASGAGQPFGGRTPYDTDSRISDSGTVAPIQGHSVAVPDTDTDPDADLAPDQASPRAADSPAQTGSVAGAGGAALSPTQQDGPRAPGGGLAAAPTRAAAPTQFLADVGAGPLPRPGSGGADVGGDAAAEAREQRTFATTALRLRDAIHADPALADSAAQVSVDVTTEGLRVQLLDEDQKPMFASGSTAVTDRARALLRRIAPVLAQLPEPITITGHTDAAAPAAAGPSNWDLSAERANAARRLLTEAGVADARLRGVTGVADRDPLLPADPLAAANRRISIMVLHDPRAAPDAARP